MLSREGGAAKLQRAGSDPCCGHKNNRPRISLQQPSVIMALPYERIGTGEVKVRELDPNHSLVGALQRPQVLLQ